MSKTTTEEPGTLLKAATAIGAALGTVAKKVGIGPDHVAATKKKRIPRRLKKQRQKAAAKAASKL